MEGEAVGLAVVAATEGAAVGVDVEGAIEGSAVDGTSVGLEVTGTLDGSAIVLLTSSCSPLSDVDASVGGMVAISLGSTQKSIPYSSLSGVEHPGISSSLRRWKQIKSPAHSALVSQSPWHL